MDRRAEDAALRIFERLAADGATFSVLSEEIGRRSLGAGYPLVLLDPVDGSLNAKQGIPLYSTMLSVLDGPYVHDSRGGYVRNLVSGEEWWALRGQGVFRNGRKLEPLAPRSGASIELLGIESSTSSILDAAPLLERAEKTRILGSMALSIAYTAAGTFDVFVSPIQARLFDMTASLLFAEEAGARATDLDGEPLGGREVGLDQRTSLLVGATPELHRLALRLYHQPASLK
jgi:myo-inositol-1(or 4)-monophosphatase